MPYITMACTCHVPDITGPPPDFSGDWDYIPPDPEDSDFDASKALPRPPPEPPEASFRAVSRPFRARS